MLHLKLSPATTLKWLGHNRVQIMCNTAGTAQVLSLTEIESHFFRFILLAEPLTDEGGEETRVPGENPRRQTSEKHRPQKKEREEKEEKQQGLEDEKVAEKKREEERQRVTAFIWVSAM